MTCSVLENYHSNFAAGRRFASPRRRNMEPLPTHVTMSFKKMPFFQIRTIHRENLQGFISQQQSANPPYPTHDSGHVYEMSVHVYSRAVISQEETDTKWGKQILKSRFFSSYTAHSSLLLIMQFALSIRAFALLHVFASY